VAFDTDGMKKRRMQKNEQLQQRLQQQKQMITRLVAAAAILVGCAALIFLLPWGRYETGPQQTTPQQTTPQQTGDVEQTTEGNIIRDPYTVIHIAAAGDLNVTDKLVASGGIMFDFSQMFQDVMPLLTEPDYTLLNFEGILSGSPYGSQLSSAPNQVLTALYNSGVDMLQVANSKIINNGTFGLETTLQSIHNAGLTSIGAYANNQEYNRSGGYVIQDIGGIRVAFVAFTKGLDGMALPEGSENCVNLLYEDYSSNYKKINSTKIKRILRNVANQKPDITIALLHWGSEYNDAHNATQESIKSLMFNNGVDAIIGTHPHYVQQMQMDQTNGTFIAYSLGDFISDAERAGTEYSVVLDLEITRDNISGETKVTGYEYTPIFTVADEKGVLKVVRLREAIEAYEAGHVSRVTKETYDKMVYALKRVEDRVKE
jgi:poly-gamma-glutamate synthesis protein (capsule biosynthesis protein)